MNKSSAKIVSFVRVKTCRESAPSKKALFFQRIERGIGWILLSIGAMILLFYGGYKMVEGLIQDAATPLLLKIGILAFLAGIAVLAASLLREQLFVRKRERYKEVEK